MELSGQNELIAKMQRNKKMPQQKAILRKYVTHTAKRSQELVPVGWGQKYPAKTPPPKGYRGGTLKRSMTVSFSNNGMRGVIKYDTDYAAYQEYGTRHLPARKYLSGPFLADKITFINELKG